jgi:L,D-transpeptidase YcbB
MKSGKGLHHSQMAALLGASPGKRQIIALMLILLMSGPPAGELSAQGTADALAAQIRARIEAASNSKVLCRGEVACRSALLPKFYSDRNFTPAWDLDQDPLNASSRMLKVLHGASSQGFRPDDYHLKEIDTLLAEFNAPSENEAENIRRLTDLDLLLTDAFLLYVADLSQGKVDPEKIDVHWHIKRTQGNDFGAILENALAAGDIDRALRELMPSDPHYAGLIRALASYRAIAQRGGWPQVPVGKTIKKGDHDARVPIIRERLMIEGDLGTTTSDEAAPFDDVLEAAVMRFQSRHGLEVDGHVGAMTLAAMNVPVEERISQIEASMERWRWLPRDFGDRYIFINVPGYQLEVYDNGQAVMSMAIIVGRYAWSTPIFESEMTYIILNPYWKVPPDIAVSDLIPRIRRDPGYLDREEIKIFGRNGGMINPRAIPWTAISKGNFPYLFRQEPGPRNALGRIAFMLPNPFDVYLHDTPERQLFERAAREFSHGCIRVEKPLDLAGYLLRDDPEWTRDKILAAVDEGKMQQVILPASMETYVLYFTAWTDRDGTVEFRQDIYRRDGAVTAALALAPE